MSEGLSSNTQAILLLTAPLIVGRAGAAPDLLSAAEYRLLARHLREIKRQPADLLSPEAVEVLDGCRAIVDPDRLQRLIGRGFLLSQAIERWQTRAIWVRSRADADYPRRLKARLKDDAPALVYGCGDIGLTQAGGFAVIGTAKPDSDAIEDARRVGGLAAEAGTTLICGGAGALDQAALRGAVEVGGRVVSVLADGLERAALNRDHRKWLIGGQLTLISADDPNAPVETGGRQRRDTLVRTLADAVLLLCAEESAAVRHDGHDEMPVFVRSAGMASAPLDALLAKGALRWPDPQDAEAFKTALDAARSGII
ncbi:MAG: DNA-processing protein DprA [Rhizobiales bacterium]|nr:DNA-processing protein DprA [Hyphomicrobiales bacterium]